MTTPTRTRRRGCSISNRTVVVVLRRIRTAGSVQGRSQLVLRFSDLDQWPIDDTELLTLPGARQTTDSPGTLQTSSSWRRARGFDVFRSTSPGWRSGHRSAGSKLASSTRPWPRGVADEPVAADPVR